MTAPHHRVLADRYRLADSIGRGGMADVFAAEDTESGQMVAVKVMRVGEAADPDRFSAEMAILERLSHPAIVPLFDSGTTEDDSPYFVMQLIDGESLSTRLREEGPLPEADLVRIACHVAGALAHAHEQGVVHRDIKPANILIESAGRGYLTDFGVARLVDATVATRAGTTIGTAAYLAPEQLQDSSVGPAADVYALGLVMIECVTGRRAFPGTGVESAMARLGRDPAIPEELPENWQGLLVAMTRRDPDRRPAAAFVEAVLRGQQPPPPLDPEELRNRTVPTRYSDEDPTAITPLTPARLAVMVGPGSAPRASYQGPVTPPPTPPPLRMPPPPGGTFDSPTAVSRRGPDDNPGRSRTLLVGVLLGAIVMLLAVGTALALRVGSSDPVVGADPPDEAMREILRVLDASETLRATAPRLTRELRARSDELVVSVNADDWDAALSGIRDMTDTLRAGADRVDIDRVAVTSLLDALQRLNAAIQDEMRAEEEDTTDGSGLGVVVAWRTLLASPGAVTAAIGTDD